ncbi:hypothetical protein C8R45DRAFT_973667 [Mycena sanguinolenta]|nr:hypothetical protein C8R45DRAFT_973667 [Mycena sanguinolenta]
MSRCSACGAFPSSNSDQFELNITITPRTMARISDLLTTNEPPQEPELLVLRPVTQKTAARLASLDAEISHLKDQLRQLQEERAALGKYHAQNTTILSPLRRMPDEILEEIFFWSLSSSRLLDVEDSPWALTHVSHRWRAIAISKSSLWSHIYLDFSIEMEYPWAMVRTQIQRARTLNISFYGSRDRDSHPQVDLLRLLLECSFVWEELRLQLTPALIPLLSAFRGRLPLLRKAFIRWDDPEGEADIDSLDFFTFSPSLADITVYCQHHFVPTLLPMHYQLTRYDFEAPWATHYELLKSLPNLQEMRIMRRFDRGVPWPQAHEPIHLVHLRKMHVSHVQCLDYLGAPVLQSISFGSHRSVDAHRHLEPFITRSSCVLHRLCIAGLPDTLCAEEILNQYSSITEFALRIVDIKGNEKIERDVLTTFFTRFTVSNSTQILPHISKLDISCENAHAIPYSLYLNMLHSRWSTPSCSLKAAELLFPNAIVDPDPESLAKMRTLCQAGMQISFLSGDFAEKRANQWLCQLSF